MDKQLVTEVDSRKRISLGKLVTASHYIVTTEEDGVIILTPAVITPRPKP
jgi:hypothetical protein